MLTTDSLIDSGMQPRITNHSGDHSGDPSGGATERHGRTVGPGLALDRGGIQALARLCKLLSDKTRLNILRCLGDGEMNVTAICECLNQAQPTISHHLGQLLQSRIVRNRRQGKQMFYRLNDEVVQEAMLPRDCDDGVSLDGSTHQVGHHPNGLQIVLPGLIVQIVSGRVSDAVFPDR